ncbi:hypothetical protein X801_09228 [Opisthorchis viverrini]|uniref:Uncharacterized protein n=2 Tax=Opisthorchis viverrini TaxID=6198 RepID=A0A074ZDZ0_OPIVI|nr:hypothetical protein T265_10258 [Opisthorchis viverrini]KER21415.1 hypothetical protein T265_10258 [Opisthorchis viverrini]OON14975.1 hypothetical protein X801_09228 [Opisthorchis viverrini]
MQLNGTFDVKLGKSFLDPDAATFMTMRCDFMPASVDRSQPGSIRVDEGKEVVVNLPNVASIGPGSTCFRGSARPVQKECILIYNKRTGELTLERVAHAVQLKKTREERKPTPCLVNTASTSNSETQSDSARRPLVPGDMGAGRDKAGPTTSPPKRKLTENTAPPVVSTSKPVANTSAKTRTLSSSSSSSGSLSASESSDSDTSNGELSDDASDAETQSQSSNLSSLSESNNTPPRKPAQSQAGQRSAKPSVVTGAKTSTNSPVSNYLPAHRKLIEHDLKLSDTDSEDSS